MNLLPNDADPKEANHDAPVSQPLTNAEARAVLESRNWELELLISGAVFFSLFQLPSIIQERTDNAIIQGSGVVIILLLFYAKTLSYVLILNLGGHFLLRGYWVGLLGLASVFPQEIVWEKLPYSTLYKDYYRQHIPSLIVTAARVDDICRMIFGFTFMLLFVVVGAGTLYGLAGVMGAILQSLLPFLSTMAAFLLTFSVLYLPLLAAGVLDYVFRKSSKEPSPRVRSVVFTLLRYGLAVTFGKLYNSLMFTLRSNLVSKKVMIVITVFLAGIIGTPLLELQLRYSNHIFFPETPSRFAMEAAFYENFRQQEGSTIDRIAYRFPSIQADMITEPYIRLFLPYRAGDNDGLRKHMEKGFQGFHREGFFLKNMAEEHDSTRTLALNGLASMYSITLNDSLCTGLEFLFHKHPHSGVPGLVTYIPTRHLREGKHVLTVRKSGATNDYVIPLYYAAPR